MTEPLPDVWATRDYPVLREAARLIDSGESAGIQALADACGLDLGEVSLSLRALQRRGLIEGQYRQAGVVGVKTLSGNAYLLTGLHPDGDDAVSQLVSALRQAADEVPDPQERSRLRALADGVGGVSRDVLSGVLTTVITAAGRGMIG